MLYSEIHVSRIHIHTLVPSHGTVTVGLVMAPPYAVSASSCIGIKESQRKKKTREWRDSRTKRTWRTQPYESASRGGPFLKIKWRPATRRRKGEQHYSALRKSEIKGGGRERKLSWYTTTTLLEKGRSPERGPPESRSAIRLTKQTAKRSPLATNGVARRSRQGT
ncbi:hypothetical protein KQX54_018407 [Cotesia glomerata]|uniref:Uncharacterized protein n=1 Tax=Cotesia glomerata TaxID=32391 RepID=A0AAV7IIK2_COTGL|nr:hypothetical protein KQX54_018407 [Cotesia glomerata]